MTDYRPIGLVVASIVGVVAGALIAKRGIHLSPGQFPDQVVYIGATVENPFPTTALEIKQVGTLAYDLGDLIGDALKRLAPPAPSATQAPATP